MRLRELVARVQCNNTVGHGFPSRQTRLRSRAENRLQTETRTVSRPRLYACRFPACVRGRFRREPDTLGRPATVQCRNAENSRGKIGLRPLACSRKRRQRAPWVFFFFFCSNDAVAYARKSAIGGPPPTSPGRPYAVVPPFWFLAPRRRRVLTDGEEERPHERQMVAGDQRQRDFPRPTGQSQEGEAVLRRCHRDGGGGDP